MKEYILGAAMLLSGVLADAIIFAEALGLEWNHNGQFSIIWNITQYGLMPAIIFFSILAVVGLLLAICGIFEK